ncbi:carbohydrate kinase [Sediminibacterium roseum]|uniref:Carbohydrate kinase n=1 Tax=Sediminibacterium roseum TaxID=1978412 RepID=A0ABW9ZT93_9BACT|nr:FGGY family carbohydrate kinase [Sediminibacterium roseum]NCI49710.1 carbohydrate kinase [Sediminibacterium roseum]
MPSSKDQHNPKPTSTFREREGERPGNINVVAIFDIGKTNKKFFLLNEQYKIVLERSAQFPETVDEDGFACDDVELLSSWVKETIREIISLPGYNVKGINFSAYGASFVLVGEDGKPVAPLYNYLKPYDPVLQENFYKTYGGEMKIAVATASPVLGNLNSGMQLYRLKNENPLLFEKVQYALHLPQYISYLITGKTYAEITSIGCHTGLWNFAARMYHDWVYAEEIDQKFPPVLRSNATIEITLDGHTIKSGIGLHDSSSALIPYLACFSEPFVLLSTGTWCISLNPFNNDPLTEEELKQDCLCYLEYHGRPVKASRLFAGNEHEQQVKRLAAHFNVPVEYFQDVAFSNVLFDQVKERNRNETVSTGLHASAFVSRGLEQFDRYEDAYHQLIADIIAQQKISTSLILSDRKVSRIFVDGGFAKNPVYMNMLANAFPSMEIFAASVSQATAIGAALAIHADWNTQGIPGDMVELKYYSITR